MLQDLNAYLGHNIPHHYHPGYITLSFITSLAGCWTAVELLHRRNGSHGPHNWYLLLSAAMIMGAVAIWCMHYVGNRATIMCDGEAALAIQYSPGFTAGSFFLAVTGVGMAFYFSNISSSVTLLGTIIGGTLMGGAICGMHYLGQVGIANYQATYAYPYVTGAALIAITASTTALTIFFFFKSKWTNSWYRRIGCAILLATAVSGMHWCATVGTAYRLISTKMNQGPTADRVINVVTVLAICSCLILVLTSWLAQRSKQKSEIRAKQVVLACVTFDSGGRLMVDSEGLLPCRKITNAFLERTFDEVFDIDHPVFSWIFRASRCWSSLSDTIPCKDAELPRTKPEYKTYESLTDDTAGFREHLRKLDDEKTLAEVQASPELSPFIGGADDYERIFKELFCVAASDLATSIQEPLVKLGFLFDDMLSTGMGKSSTFTSRIFCGNRISDVDLESNAGSSSHLFGLGQLLFAVREVNEQGSAHLQSSGFTFTQQSYVIDRLASRMQVPRLVLQSRLKRMRAFAKQEHVLEPGIHVAVFILKPLLNRGFDVLVRNDARNLLPSIRISSDRLTPTHLRVLAQLDGSTVSACRERFRRRYSYSESYEFALKVLQALNHLSKSLDEEVLCNARLVAEPLMTPSSALSTQSEAHIIAFRTILDVHKSHRPDPQYEYTPLKFFITRQHAYHHSPDIKNFGRRVGLEFAHLAERTKGREKHSFTHTAGRKTGSIQSRRSHSPPLDVMNGGGGSVRDSHRLTRNSSVDTLELTKLTTAGKEDGGIEYVEEESFAERLVALTIDERKTRARGSR